MKRASGGMSIRRHGDVSPERRYKAHLPGKGLPRPNGSECILAEVSFLFFFFLTLKNKHFCSSQISTFLKAKEYVEFPQVSEKKKNKARIKICRISSYIYLPLQLQPLFLHSVHTKTHIHTPYIQPFKHLKRKDHFIWSITDKQDKVLFRNSQLQIQRVLIYKRS